MMIENPQTFIVENLADLEKYVNDRRRSSSCATSLPSDLIPDTAPDRPMLWVVLPKSEVKIISDSEGGNAPDYCNCLINNKKNVAYFPIHPLEVHAYKGYEIIESGIARISASYRTFFYENSSDSPIYFNPPEHSQLMVKLHLEKPLSGVEGDRRLTPAITQKCILFSRELGKLKSEGKVYSKLFFAQEEVGLLHGNRGAIIRRLPDEQLIPAFSLSSLDRRDSDREIICISILRRAQEVTGEASATLFGEVFARPLFESLFSAFSQGFSLEMHMQNTLFQFNNSGFVGKIIYRDFEGIVFSDKFRMLRGLPLLFDESNLSELHENANKFRLFFNRNLDHDISRILQNILDANLEQGFWNAKEYSIAVKSVKQVLREIMSRYGLTWWSFWPRLFKLSRTPYGNGTRRFHYYKCFFR